MDNKTEYNNKIEAMVLDINKRVIEAYNVIKNDEFCLVYDSKSGKFGEEEELFSENNYVLKIFNMKNTCFYYLFGRTDNMYLAELIKSTNYTSSLNISKDKITNFLEISIIYSQGTVEKLSTSGSVNFNGYEVAYGSDIKSFADRLAARYFNNMKETSALLQVFSKLPEEMRSAPINYNEFWGEIGKGITDLKSKIDTNLGSFDKSMNYLNIYRTDAPKFLKLLMGAEEEKQDFLLEEILTKVNKGELAQNAEVDEIISQKFAEKIAEITRKKIKEEKENGQF